MTPSELVALATANPHAMRVAALTAYLRDLFPETVAEDGGIDFDKLRALLDQGAEDEGAPERYALTWAGKRAALAAIRQPSTATLVPVPEASIAWETTRNVFIAGENLEVLKLLFKPYFGRVNMIYIDPPYNTGSDFIYPDDFSDPLGRYLELTGQRDSAGNWLTSNPETGGRYHSAWLTMLYPRLFLARQLLRDDGFICVSIGEEELANLRLLMNEIFGEPNYRNTILVRRYNKNLSRQFMDRGLTSLSVGAEYVLVYSRSQAATMNPVFRPASEQRRTQGYWKGFWNAADRPTMRYPLLGVQPETGQWKWKADVAFEAVRNYEEYARDYADRMSLEDYWEQTGKRKRFIRRNPQGMGKNLGVEHWVAPAEGILRSSDWTDILASQTLASLGLEFDNPKNVELLKTLILMCADADALILDFFAGSGSTAHAVLELNRQDGGARQFIAVQLPEPLPDPAEGSRTIADIALARVRRVIEKLSAQSQAGDLGFKVYRLAPSQLRQTTAFEAASPEEYAEQLETALESLRPGYDTAAVIAEVALKDAGFTLNYTTEVLPIPDQTVYKVTDVERGQVFYISLDEQVRLAALPLSPDDLFVCRATAVDDETAANLALRCTLHFI